MAGMMFGLSLNTATAQEVRVPEWIKNNAGWWAEDAIPDSTFIDGIEFLIKNEIILIPNLPNMPSGTTESIPSWVKNNAGWWADGQIDDHTFVNGIKYLVETGVIVIEQTENSWGSLSSNNFVKNPSERKLFDTQVIVESGYSGNAIIHYMETEEKDKDGNDFTQIWITVNTINDRTIHFTFLKYSETVMEEYDNVKLVLIEGLAKNDDGVIKNYLYVEEYGNNRMIKSMEYDDGELFRKLEEPKYLLALDKMGAYQSDYQFRTGFEDKYNKISMANEVNKAVVIIPTFTASAYSPNGFYDFYGGTCDETCLTISITNTIADFRFSSSVSAVKILDLLDYESITDRQLHNNPNVLDEYDSVIVLHNEYVSRTMFDAITSHDNVIFLYPNALYAEVNVDTTNNSITLVRGHNYPSADIINGFDWKNENTHPYEYDTECENWEFYPTKGTPNGYMLNCYPENIIWKDELFLKTLKDLVS